MYTFLQHYQIEKVDNNQGMGKVMHEYFGYNNRRQGVDTGKDMQIECQYTLYEIAKETE